VAGDQIRHTLETRGVSIKLNEKIDPAPQETWTERPVLKLSDGTIASPGLTLIATGRKPNVEELGLESIGIAADRFIPVNEKDADG
jgi:pyruvate/2-oxoglutarate dehydrogenase complex dihydrolipoamide dehydrogenase (E3) component